MQRPCLLRAGCHLSPGFFFGKMPWKNEKMCFHTFKEPCSWTIKQICKVRWLISKYSNKTLVLRGRKDIHVLGFAKDHLLQPTSVITAPPSVQAHRAHQAHRPIQARASTGRVELAL